MIFRLHGIMRLIRASGFFGLVLGLCPGLDLGLGLDMGLGPALGLGLSLDPGLGLLDLGLGLGLGLGLQAVSENWAARWVLQHSFQSQGRVGIKRLQYASACSA